MTLKNVLIVGGGTAGWMAACMLAHHWQSTGIVVTLIESPSKGSIGVGEGSTPFLRDFFMRLGIEESEWMPACDATYKCGIDFPGWTNSEAPSEYFHPFYGQADAENAYQFFASCLRKRDGYDVPCHPNDFFLGHYLAKQNKGPFTHSGDNKGVDYGYHFDAYKLGQFLAQHAKSLGAVHIIDDVAHVDASKQGIRSIETKQNGSLNADFYIDCSGLQGLLIQQSLNEPLICYQKYLANNSAVAISTDTEQSKVKGTYTLSKGMQHGWMWSIPLQSRTGNGYVYSDKHITGEQAEQALRDELGEYEKSALHIHWQPGRISQHWKHNCLAVGLSQGFLEPLEAPMLNLIQQTCESFLEHSDVAFNEQQRARFNTSINLLIDGTRDYLQAHYLLNTRTDSPYWENARNNTEVSDVLRDIIDAWDKPAIFERALAKHAHKLAYGKTSWYCILAGMNRFNAASKGALEHIQRQHLTTIAKCEQRAKEFVLAPALFS